MLLWFYRLRTPATRRALHKGPSECRTGPHETAVVEGLVFPLLQADSRRRRHHRDVSQIAAPAAPADSPPRTRVAGSALSVYSIVRSRCSGSRRCATIATRSLEGT